MANDFSDNVLNSVACRLCNRVFISTQALVTHIESHMKNEEAAIRRLYSIEHIIPQRRFPSHCFPLGFHVPLMDTQNMNEGRTFQPQPMMIPQPRKKQFLSVGSMQMQFSPRVYQLKHLEEESSNDGTKAYIMQLEKPIKKIDFIDLVNNDDDDDNSDVHALDLALKL
ncbi:unnamed protein product [Lathyrus sativus]|nr:unnamed protein product [Lathyrus sativus]